MQRSLIIHTSCNIYIDTVEALSVRVIVCVRECTSVCLGMSVLKKCACVYGCVRACTHVCVCACVCSSLHNDMVFNTKLHMCTVGLG